MQPPTVSNRVRFIAFIIAPWIPAVKFFINFLFAGTTVRLPTIGVAREFVKLTRIFVNTATVASFQHSGLGYGIHPGHISPTYNLKFANDKMFHIPASI
jgi:hypothetical protein